MNQCRQKVFVLVLNGHTQMWGNCFDRRRGARRDDLQSLLKGIHRVALNCKHQKYENSFVKHEKRRAWEKSLEATFPPCIHLNDCCIKGACSSDCWFTKPTKLQNFLRHIAPIQSPRGVEGQSFRQALCLKHGDAFSEVEKVSVYLHY